MDSSSPEAIASVDSLTDNFKNQSLGADDSLHDKNDHSSNNNTSKDKYTLEDLNWDHSFVTELPGDPRTDNIPRQWQSKGRTWCNCCRVAQSFLRFGSYQIHASRGKEDLDIVCALADYAIRRHFPHIENMSKSESLSFSTGNQDHSVVDLTSNKYAAWTVEAAERIASLVASWQGFGFTHGVLNTDNMSIWGLTIDYGPFGFLDAFDPSYTPNTTDLPGRRYCFANQPDIGLWNIAQFTASLSGAQLIDDKEVNYATERYGTKFMDEYQAIMTRKLGLPKYNKQLISKLLNNMAVDKDDYTNFFWLLSNIKAGPNILEDELIVPLKAVLLDIGKERKEAWTNWVQSYEQEVQ
ncbi:hypothetical protein P3X46_023993 [Hevea brasiliensis]|uniref:Selenoprotein O n=1 Tax=Hevea brasiliensis TaxID=3981 RepID=A0ABQ9LCP0_HEVBR|nr:hypothetical protein P3X46_023993 [Hevea brasiliensis]